MKIFLTPLLLTFLFSPLLLMSQTVPDGGGARQQEAREACLPAADRAVIQEQLTVTLQQLRREGKIPAEDQKLNQTLEWPLRLVGIDWPNYYGISNFVDLNDESGILDYTCRQRSYDGHNGTDFFTWPFPYYLKDLDAVEVVAAAPGVIIGKDDGQPDENCAWSNQRWNAVYVRHDNGTVAWYGHLKRNSLTQKAVGQRLETGDYIGVVASSGRSDGPHLHLEFQTSTGEIIDPYGGNCNDVDSGLLRWREQQAYQEPTINAVLLHAAPPVHDCPGSQERENITDAYDLGDQVIVGAYFKDQIVGDIVTYRMLGPDGSQVQRWIQVFEQNFNGSWWWFRRNLGAGAVAGDYVMEAILLGDTVRQPFTYGVTTSTQTPRESDLKIYPNPVTDHLNFPTNLRLRNCKLLDLRGRIVAEKEVASGGSLSVAGLPAGVYLLVWENDRREVFRQRIVKR
ncbi:peptidoglycan DD-metalloendopeptidase family protein [Lewinella sp. W8]|uniref:peptidoglycan DD-metalloendopeptidase family protein n=1 Tax=Lewinella sp. W8 TaxID=2528208 RepID=UPI001067E98D|nr:peptidoglycan DD-metalloendopeptidase family protein [Lewinella sp. W8]MTB52993.1 peptidoglycan DD-metalloendopeptidase family protein [Lewinella sp. W8]